MSEHEHSQVCIHTVLYSSVQVHVFLLSSKARRCTLNFNINKILHLVYLLFLKTKIKNEYLACC